jgi:hypothetical protein
MCTYGADGVFSCSIMQPRPFMQPLTRVENASTPTIIEGFESSGGVASLSASAMDMSTSAIKNSKNGIIASDGTRAEAAKVDNDATWATLSSRVDHAINQAASARAHISNVPQPAHGSALAPGFI